jgi:3-dehydroquinate synthase
LTRGYERRRGEDARTTAFVLSLGSNLGDRRAHLESGLASLAEHLDIEDVSRLVESAPWGPVPQGPYLNIAVRGRTTLSPLELLRVVQEAEEREGRERGVRYGPRTLDIDVVFFGDVVSDAPELILPHPRWSERPFVFALVGDVAGDFVDARSGRAVSELASAGALPSGLVEVNPSVALPQGGTSGMSVGATGSEVRVRSSSGEYSVRVGPGVVQELSELLARHSPAHRYAVISDERVFELHGEGVLAWMGELRAVTSAHTFPAGEESKNRAEWSRLTDELLALGMGRDGCVIALGGGVAGDLAGFVAASYMRGIPVVQIPTSLVAMVDASVGGKTGVDVPAGKNLVGAFHPPRFVLADTELASTLPREERSQGLAEAVKHGAILDAEYLSRILAAAPRLLEGDPADTSWMVLRSVELKAAVVSEDEQEAGRRQILNFGHTLGHAIEAASGYRVRHGSAVAIGMVLEARLGEILGVTRRGVAGELEEALEAVELPFRPPDELDVERILELVSRDKKVRSGEARYVLLRDLGTVDPGEGWSRSVPSGAVRELLENAHKSDL